MLSAEPLRTLPITAGTRDARRSAATRIATWLVAGPAQQARGEHAGGVAGWIDDDGRARYVYPEITGYYLQWLASIVERNGVLPSYVDRAASAQRWLARWLDSSNPPTRVYLERMESDWRNRTLFTFDLAMVLRGLGSAARARVVAPDRTVVDRLCERLIALTAADGELDARSRSSHGAGLPDRWSTRRGAFLAKAAAGIVDASTMLNVPDALRHAADRTFESAIAALISVPHDETHPFLYAIEGFLALPRHSMFAARMPKVAEHFKRLLATIISRGRVPERSDDDGGPCRLDIVAQTIRAGLLLDAHDALAAPERKLLDDLADSLVSSVRTDGGIPFDADAPMIQLNVWTAMFAEQALSMSASSNTDIASIAAAPRIV